MKKIPTIFIRDWNSKGRLVTDEKNPACDWVFNGEGVATRKYDGTCVKIEYDKYYKRREVKQGKPIPENYIEEDYDRETKKSIGWIEVEPSDPSNKWHMEAFDDKLPDGTYELLGPKIQGNPELFNIHVLFGHKQALRYFDAPRAFEGLKDWLSDMDIEGLVFHHEDGRMAKIKKKDFGLKRK